MEICKSSEFNMDKNIYQILSEIQNELKVPKTRVNTFAKKPFNYRNAEDILSAVKPICKAYGCTIVLTDEVVLIGDRYYMKATAVILNGEGSIGVDAFARECASRSGFDEAQLTGSASSYARKYALNGLFGLDDNEDPDDKPPVEDGAAKKSTQKRDAALPAIPPCPVCGNPMTEITGRSGFKYSPQQALEKYGMCESCLREQKKT